VKGETNLLISPNGRDGFVHLLHLKLDNLVLWITFTVVSVKIMSIGCYEELQVKTYFVITA